MRCLVTGAAGFVGSHLAERLLAEGHEVCGIDAFIDYYPRAFKEQNLQGARSWERFRLIEGDLLTLDLAPLIEGVNWIFHQAAQAGVRASWGQEFARYVDCNVLATQRLLEAALHSPALQRFVYASSSSVYGNAAMRPAHGPATPQPISPYGVTKLAAEHLCTLYHHNFGVPSVSLRYFTVYGPRQRPDMAFHRFCKSILAHEPVHLYGDGRQTRDFTYIADVVEANLRAATSERAAGEVMDIAGGSCVVLRDVIGLLEEISGTPVTVVYAEQQHGDAHATAGHTERARQVLGFRPRVSLRKGLAAEFAYITSLYQDAEGTQALPV